MAALGVIMFIGFGDSLDARLADLNLPPGPRQQLQEQKLRLGAAQASEGPDTDQSARVERAIEGSFVSGHRVVMLVAVAMVVASTVSATILFEGVEAKG